MKDSSEQSFRLAEQLREQDKLSLIYSEASEIARCVQERLMESLEFCGEAEINVVVNVDEDWPYTVYVEAEAKTRHCSRAKVQELVEKTIEECVESARNRLEKQGIYALP